MTQDNDRPNESPIDDEERALLADAKALGVSRGRMSSDEVWDSIEPRSITEDIDDYRKKLRNQVREKIALPAPSEPRAQLENVYSYAVESLLEVLSNPKTRDSVKLQAAQYVIDHTIGKAKQEVEHTGSLAIEIRAQVAAIIKLQAEGTHIPEISNILAKPRTRSDDFLDRHMPEKFVVGKRGTKINESVSNSSPGEISSGDIVKDADSSEG